MKAFFLGPLLALRTQLQRRLQGRGGFGVRLLHGLRRRDPCVAPHEFSCDCDGCGRVFVPTPDSFILTGPVWAVAVDGGSETCVVGPEEPLTSAKLAGLSEFELNELGLTEEDRKALLAGDRVFTGADAFCPECLHQIFK
ncbi:MAG: hypothetical protein JOY92_00225 [Verrucomicrobia bacterium]|jgi:hypothetical protein|nr:hypothetical protein [Verrucomicrobiota bacterium]